MNAFPPYEPDAPFGEPENPLGKSTIDLALAEPDEQAKFDVLPAGMSWVGNILGTTGHEWLESLAVGGGGGIPPAALWSEAIRRERVACCKNYATCARAKQFLSDREQCSGGYTKALPDDKACIDNLTKAMAVVSRDYLPAMQGVKPIAIEGPARGILTLDTGRIVHVGTVGIDLIYARGADPLIDDYKFSPNAPSDDSAQHDLYRWLVACGFICRRRQPEVPGHHAVAWDKVDPASMIPLRLWPDEFRYICPGRVVADPRAPLIVRHTGTPQRVTASLVRKVRRYLDKFPPPLRVAMPTTHTPKETDMPPKPSPFKRATKADARLRMALIGPAGSGKTYTALRVACELGQRVAVIDTERGSASKYADEFEFDVFELENFNPRAYVELIEAAASHFDVLVIDSISHAWAGPGGVLEYVDAKMDSSKGNKFAAWRDATPLHNELVNAIIGSDCHIIATMRAKMEYVQERDDKGKTVVRRVGSQPVQREGLEYEFDVIGDLDNASLTVSKTRCRELHGKRWVNPGREVAGILRAWLGGGKSPAAIQPVEPREPARAEPEREPVEPADESHHEDEPAAKVAAPAPVSADRMENARKLWGEARTEAMARAMSRLSLNLEALKVPAHDMPGMLLARVRDQYGGSPATVASLLDSEIGWLIGRTDDALDAKGIPRPTREPDAKEAHEIAVKELIGNVTQVKGGANGSMSSGAKEVKRFAMAFPGLVAPVKAFIDSRKVECVGELIASDQSALVDSLTKLVAANSNEAK